MDQSLVLTVIGEDRPGLVEALAGTIAEHDGSWLESRMAHLAGQFAGILRVRVPQARAEALVAALEQLRERGLRVDAQRAGGEIGEFRPVRLHLVGSDRAGIVREISVVLARHGINVEELNTACRPAPMSGQPLFEATAVLQLPPEASVDGLRGDLEAVGHDLMVDISVES